MSAPSPLELWLTDSESSTRKVLSSLTGKITPEQEAELRAEVDVYRAASDFLRAGRGPAKPPGSAPPASVIDQLRREIHGSIERAYETAEEAEEHGQAQHGRTLRNDADTAERLLAFLEKYWSKAPAAE